MIDKIIVYVCPNDECGSYYGSSSMPELEKENVLAPSHAKDAGEVRHTRARCPNCGEERIRCVATLVPIQPVGEPSNA